MNNPSSPDPIEQASIPGHIGKLAEALAKAQAEMAGAKKDSQNPYFNSKYADLASVWEACRDALTKNGLAVIQPTERAATGLLLVTYLVHSSGEYVRGELPLPQPKDMQALGSTLTYARRYALASMVGVAPEDDDGEAAMDRSTTPKKGAAPPPKPKGLDGIVAQHAPPTDAKVGKVWSKSWQANPEKALETRIPVSMPMWNEWADKPTGLGPFVDKGHDTWRKVSRGSLNGYRHKMLVAAVKAAEEKPEEATEYHERAACTLAVLEWLAAHKPTGPAKTEPAPEDDKRHAQPKEPQLFGGAK